MTVARSEIVNLSVTRYYYCTSECVRQESLCGDQYSHRKEWLVRRAEVLSQSFAIAVCGFAALDSEIRAVVRLEPERADTWSSEEVIRRWIRVVPPSGLDLNDAEAVDKYVEETAQNENEVRERRSNLKDLGWFMKALKEPLSVLANKEDRRRGAFWAARYKSVAILDEEALISSLVLVEVVTPEDCWRELFDDSTVAAADSPNYTSLQLRQQPKQGPGDELTCRADTAQGGASSRDISSEQLEDCPASPATPHGDGEGDVSMREHDQALWLCPVEDRLREGAARQGMFSGIELAGYLRLVRSAAAFSDRIPPPSADTVAAAERVLEAFGTSMPRWASRVVRLIQAERLVGHYFAMDEARLQQVARSKGRRLRNLTASSI